MKRMLLRYLSGVGQFLNVNLRGLVKIGATICAAFWAGKSSLYEAASKTVRVFTAKLNMLTNKFSGGLKSIIGNKAVARIRENDALAERGKLVSKPRFLIDVSIHHFLKVATTVTNSAVMLARMLSAAAETLNTNMRSLYSATSRANGFDPNKIIGKSGIFARAKALMLPKTVKRYAGKIRTALSNSSRLATFDRASASSGAMSGNCSTLMMAVEHWDYPHQYGDNLKIFQVLNANSLGRTLTITND